MRANAGKKKLIQCKGQENITLVVIGLKKLHVAAASMQKISKDETKSNVLLLSKVVSELFI